jgi:hypothetical protein
LHIIVGEYIADTTRKHRRSLIAPEARTLIRVNCTVMLAPMLHEQQQAPTGRPDRCMYVRSLYISAVSAWDTEHPGAANTVVPPKWASASSTAACCHRAIEAMPPPSSSASSSAGATPLLHECTHVTIQHVNEGSHTVAACARVYTCKLIFTKRVNECASVQQCPRCTRCGCDTTLYCIAAHVYYYIGGNLCQRPIRAI